MITIRRWSAFLVVRRNLVVCNLFFFRWSFLGSGDVGLPSLCFSLLKSHTLVDFDYSDRAAGTNNINK
jgi:hypothetical protein